MDFFLGHQDACLWNQPNILLELEVRTPPPFPNHPVLGAGLSLPLGFGFVSVADALESRFRFLQEPGLASPCSTCRARAGLCRFVLARFGRVTLANPKEPPKAVVLLGGKFPPLTHARVRGKLFLFVFRTSPGWGFTLEWLVRRNPPGCQPQ